MTDVAVVITCFDEGDVVEAALDSVLAQGAADRIAQIVLVADGSPPATSQVLDRLEGRDPRLRLLRGPGGWGVSGARNRGVAATSAPLLAFLDADDLWAPDKLARQVSVLQADPAIALVYTGYEALAAGADNGEARRVYDLSGDDRAARRYFLRDPPILPSSVLMRREAFEALGGFDPTVTVFEDTDFFLRLAQVAQLKGLPDPLIRKRYRADSLSAPRPGLMAHHAFVAFRGAALDPDLTPLVPRRLAERAARLGLVAYYAGDLEAARGHAAMARALRWWTPRAMLLAALLAGGEPLRGALEGRLRSRRRLHGH